MGLLAINAGRSIPTEQLIDWLWSDGSAPAGAKGVIQVNASRLRRQLPRDVTIVGRRGSYTLHGAAPLTDAALFEEMVKGARREGRDADGTFVAQVAGALALWRATPLEGIDDLQIVQRERTRLEELRRDVEEEHLEARLDGGALTSAARSGPPQADIVAYCRALVEGAPYRENRWRLLMLCLYGADRQAEALAAYSDAVRLLRDELGVDPGIALRKTHERILLHDPHLAATAQAAPLPVPAERTALIGRDELLVGVWQQLASSRLVTLIGPGGVGKTRVAQRLALEVQDRFRHGAAWIDVDALDPRSLPTTVASALGTDVGPDGAMVAIGYRDQLVILDTCEAMLSEVALLAERILAGFPGVLVLATSREPLEVLGERRVLVPGLNDAATSGDAGVHLLRERMVDLGADPQRHPDHLLSRVVDLLDGIPLAIELTANRLSHIPTEQLRSYLDDSATRSLTGRRASGPPRQHSMDATVEWSYGLMTADSRRGLLAAGLLPDGIDADQMKAVLGDDETRADDVLDDLARRALLRDRQGRYRAPDGVREFAKRTESSDPAGAGLRLRAELISVLAIQAQQTAAAYFAPDRAEVYARTSQQDRNHVQAITWLVESARSSEALGHVLCLGRYWGQFGWATSRAGLVQEVIAAAVAADAPAPLLVQAGLVGSWLSMWADHMAEADAGLTETLRVAEATGDPALIGLALHSRGNVDAFGRGRVALGEQSFAKAVDLLSEIDHPFLPAVLWSHVWALSISGDVKRASEVLEMGRRRFAASADPVTEFGLYLSEALLGVYAGDLTTIDVAVDRARQAATKFAVGQMASQVTCVEVWAALCRGQGAIALKASRVALDQSRAMGAVTRDGYILALAALAAGCDGDATAAASLARRSLEASEPNDERESIALAVLARSVAAGLDGRSGAARQLWEESAAIRLDAGIALPPAVEAWTAPR